jgi:hypothetical protein
MTNQKPDMLTSVLLEKIESQNVLIDSLTTRNESLKRDLQQAKGFFEKINELENLVRELQLQLLTQEQILERINSIGKYLPKDGD